ncbi:hypothetical protein EJB05_21603 [Eragrostis curvula]|uniref:Cytochrome P450 n=1 Tax=Eragrostis curvula TaxID=38414 RepID=A0A5J9V1X2_9POAL|nr:hypothetical protein EJB05_21603 [Eragrostis curvula]
MASFMLAALAWCIPMVMFIFAMEIINVRRWPDLPPGPRPLPVIGNFHVIARSSAHLHRSLAQLAERYGPLMTIWLGRRIPTIIVSTPDAAREVLHNADLAARPAMDAWRAEGHAANSVIYLPPHGKWRAMRRFAATELFAKGRLDALQLLRQEKVQEMVRHVSEHAARGESVEVGHAAFVTVLDLLSRTLFSVDLGTLQGVRHMVRAASVLAATPTISDAIPALAAADLQGARRKLGALIRYAHRVIDEQFAGRRRGRDAGDPRKNDMMDVVLDKEPEWKEGGSPMNYDAVKGMFTEFFVAGTETTSSTVEWAMAELLRHPEWMSKVREELRTVIGTKRVMEESDIGKLPYLQAVVKETLRLHTVVALGFYQAMATTQVQGYTIPKGSTILVNFWAIHRQGDIWTHPDKFMPERFIAKDISFWGNDFELIPFGAGRRICLGLPLAHRMVHLMLGSLISNFSWTLPPEIEENGIDMTDKFGTMVSMATPLKALAANKCDE